MRVVICGAGIGGLTLAQALRDHCDVLVLDRDPEAMATGGYRLALNGPATAVFTRHLDRELMAEIRAVSDGTERFAQVAAFSFRAADPRADLTPWTPRRVTALGDAVHAMPPTGGQAASTAIRDAGYLADQILAHLRDGSPLPDALLRYHQAMPGWARPAVSESLGPVRILRALRNPLVAAAARPGLAVAGRFSRAKNVQGSPPGHPVSVPPAR